MISLTGYAHSSGTIAFPRTENAWAFQRMDADMKSGQEKRVVVKPEIARIVVLPSPKATLDELPWMERTQMLLSTAETVYLERHEDLLRFRQAIHKISKDQQFVTLGSQEEVDEFSHSRWSKLSHFYAARREGFRFDITKAICRMRDIDKKSNQMEISTRLFEYEYDELPRLTFDATGSDVHTDLISWRSMVKDGESGRFAPEGTRLQLRIRGIKQPFSLIYEFRSDLNSHWYIFDQELVGNEMTKLELKAKKLKPDS